MCPIQGIHSEDIVDVVFVFGKEPQLTLTDQGMTVADWFDVQHLNAFKVSRRRSNPLSSFNSPMTSVAKQTIALFVSMVLPFDHLTWQNGTLAFGTGKSHFWPVKMPQQGSRGRGFRVF